MLTIKNPKTFDWANIGLLDCLEGNALDTYFTYKLYKVLIKILEDQDITPLLENLITPLLSIFSDMELEGLDISENNLNALDKELKDKNINLEDKLYLWKQVHKTDNLASDIDMREILYTREGGFELYPPDRTKKKEEPSTSAPTIETILLQIDDELKRRYAKKK